MKLIEKLRLLSLLTLATLLLVSCTLDHPVLRHVIQPESPLGPGVPMELRQNEWRLVEVVHQGEPVQFDSLRPVYISFPPNQVLWITSGYCRSGGFDFMPTAEQRYWLLPAVMPAQRCGEPLDEQYFDMHDAIKATVEYEFEGEQLIMKGPETRAVLVPKNPG